MKVKKQKSRFLGTALFEAVEEYDYAGAEKLLEIGADPDTEVMENSIKERILLRAAYTGYKMAILLIDYGADVDFEFETGCKVENYEMIINEKAVFSHSIIAVSYTHLTLPTKRIV